MIGSLTLFHRSLRLALSFFFFCSLNWTLFYWSVFKVSGSLTVLSVVKHIWWTFIPIIGLLILEFSFLLFCVCSEIIGEMCLTNCFDAGTLALLCCPQLVSGYKMQQWATDSPWAFIIRWYCPGLLSLMFWNPEFLCENRVIRRNEI